MSVNSLMNELRKKNWNYKKKDYIQHFEKAERKRVVSEPNISIIIISWRLHPDTIKNLQILQEQRYNNFELIFVNNGGSEEEFIDLFPYMDTYIKLNKNTGAYLARNIGAVFANGPILLFLEDDGIPDIQLVESHLLTFKVYDVLFVRGIYFPKTKHNKFNLKQKHYFHGDKCFPSYIDLEGNAAINAEVFYQVGGWDDKIVFGHGGPDLSIRLLEYEPDMKKQIYCPYSIIFHDYANNEEHIQQKREKQKLSKERLKRKHRLWDSLLNTWRNFYHMEQKILPRVNKQGGVWEEFEKQKKKIIKRNEKFFGQDFFYLDDTKLIDTLRENSHYNISIFGTGELGKLTYNYLKLNGIKVKNFYDNNFKNCGSFIENIAVKNPSELIAGIDFILIASAWYEEISLQLEKQGCQKDKCYLIVKK
jgi:GT2 family glycosyltransferase